MTGWPLRIFEKALLDVGAQDGQVKAQVSFKGRIRKLELYVDVKSSAVDDGNASSEGISAVPL